MKILLHVVDELFRLAGNVKLRDIGRDVFDELAMRISKRVLDIALQQRQHLN